MWVLRRDLTTYRCVYSEKNIITRKRVNFFMDFLTQNCYVENFMTIFRHISVVFPICEKKIDEMSLSIIFDQLFGNGFILTTGLLCLKWQKLSNIFYWISCYADNSLKFSYLYSRFTTTYKNPSAASPETYYSAKSNIFTSFITLICLSASSFFFFVS